MTRVADYIAQTLEQYGISHIFCVTGGGAMHLNDAFGRNPHIKAVYCHHEQACAMAAESFFRLTNRLAAVSVTTGPGATNAITGVYGAYVDSMGMIIISGQVKKEMLVRNTNLSLRQLGDQEVDIVKMVSGITKYSALVTDALKIKYHLEKALFLAKNGRPGPCWLDVPIDVQATEIHTKSLAGYAASEDVTSYETMDLRLAAEETVNRLVQAKRPVIYAGTGIRLSGQYERFRRLIKTLGIPVVTAWNSNDLLPDGDSVYAGRPGIIGNRAGNFTVQNSDLLLVLGCRLNVRLVSYSWKSFAPQAYKIMVDVDGAELKKPTLKVDFPIHADLAEFLPVLESAVAKWKPLHESWLAWCKTRLANYPVVQAEYWNKPAPVNPYCFMDRLFDQLQENEIVVCGDGTACVTAFQAAKVKEGQRLFHNSGAASMGYDLPAAVGAAFAHPSAKRIICLAGDGSIMMNLQELQTIQGNQLPVKIFVLNNGGYHSIRQTQSTYFPDNIVGCGLDSGLSFPDFGKLAAAFNLPYFKVSAHADLESTIAEVINTKGAVLCEVILDLNQQFAPKLSSRKFADGTMASSSLENMAPFLSSEELLSNVALSE